MSEENIIRIPDYFEQAARLNELRDDSGIKIRKLDAWLAFQRAVIEFYEPLVMHAAKAKNMADEIASKKKQIERLSQVSLFNDAYTRRQP